jgi:23S rRNA pseudouridine1911/1915/1917 synthase
LAASTPKPVDLIIAAEQKGQRLDHFLATLPGLDLSRTQAKKLLEDGSLKVNNAPAEPSYKIKANDRISGAIPPAAEPTVKPEKITLEIVYEDDDIIVVNKPQGMVTHPAPGNFSGTLVNALLHHTTHLASHGAPLRPGIVHRLDKDTSGLLVVAKSDRAYLELIKQFKNRTVEKTYVALVHGLVKNESGVIEENIGRHPVNRQKMAVLKNEGRGTKGRSAYTEYRVLERYKDTTLVEVKIRTGRTHQIRVHLSHIGHPLVGDQTYGKKTTGLEVNGQRLHAKKLAFAHPVTGKRVEFDSALPAGFKQ